MKRYISNSIARMFSPIARGKAKRGFLMIVTYRGQTHYLGFITGYGYYLKPY